MLIEEIKKKTIIHGNGFSQTQLNDEGTLRLHVWDNRIPRQNIDTNIHNHRFDFVSCVLKGTLINIGLDFIPTTNTILYYANANDYFLMKTSPHGIGENNQLESTEEFGRFKPSKTIIKATGESYYWQGSDFHITHHLGTTVTVIKKVKINQEEAKIACPVGQYPDNSFDRNNQIVEPWLLETIELYIPMALNIFY